MINSLQDLQFQLRWSKHTLTNLSFINTGQNTFKNFWKSYLRTLKNTSKQIGEENKNSKKEQYSGQFPVLSPPQSSLA